METERKIQDLMVTLEAEIAVLKAQFFEDINYLSPMETIAGKIQKKEALRDELKKEWYINSQL